jgi:uncharacterized phage-like protein YoqJ
MIRICFTGHRPNKLGGYDWSSKKNQNIMFELYVKIETLLKDNLNENFRFICGGALGIDQMAFDICYKTKRFTCPELQIELVLAMPFKNQDNNWIQESKDKLKSQRERADKVVLVDTLDKYKCNKVPVGEYHTEKMQLRNEFMVNNSDIVIAVWDGTNGGTANCVKYAQVENKEIIIIDPNKV